MRIRHLIGLLVLAVSLMLIPAAAAQDIAVEWTSWNTQITAHDNGAPLDAAETQTIAVTSGQVRGGTRDFDVPVNIQGVFAAVNGGQPQQLQQGSGVGTYQVEQSSDGALLDYTLPQAVSAGSSFVLQINFTTEPAADGLINWYVVPAGNPGAVQSARLTMNFPEGQTPDPSFVRIPEGSGTVTVNGNSIVVQSNGAVQPGAAFAVQAPFGTSVGQPANPPANNPPVSNPVQSAPVAPSADTGIDLGGILPILCIVGVIIVVVLVGGLRNAASGVTRGIGGGIGSSIGRGILGGILGGGTRNGGGGIFGGGSGGSGGSSGGGFFGGGSSGGSSGSTRGFRASSNQTRSTPTVRGSKRRGGGSSFK